MLENFIYAKRKDLFTAELDAGNILNEAVVFIEDTKEIWNHGTYFNCSTPNLHGIQGKLFVFDRNSIDSNTGIVKQDVYTQLMEAIEDNWHVMVNLEGIIQEYNSNAWASPVTAIAQTDGNDIIMYTQPLGVYSNRIYNHTFKFTIFGNNRQLQSEVLYETGKVVCLDVNNFTEEDYIAALVSPIGTPVFINDSRDNVSIRPDGIKWQGMITSLYSTSQTSYTLRVYQHISDEDGDVTIKVANATLNASGSLIITELGSHKLLINGNGDKYLSDNGNYNKIKTSELENDLPFVVDDASNPLNNRVTNLENNKADKTAIPTKVSQLQNDVPYVVDNTLPANGLYIYDTDGNFTLPDNWDTANNSKAVGVAILGENCKFVVAKDDIGQKSWGGYGTDIASLTSYTSSTEAAKDFAGITNTQVIIDAIGQTNDGYRTGSAAQDCVDYIFPNGQVGYLGAAGEWQVAQQNKNALNSALTLIGGTAMTEYGYWTSTWSSSVAAWVQFYNHNFLGKNNTDQKYYYVRAFLAIEEPKSVKDKLNDIENNYVTLDTNQSITGIKTFESPIKVEQLQTPTTDESGMLQPGPVQIRYYNNGFQDTVSFYSGINMENQTPINYYNSNMTGGNIQIIAQDNYFNTGGGSVTIGNKDTSDTEHAICSYVSVIGSETRNKIIVLGINNDTKIKSLNFDNQNCTELFTDNLLLSSVLEEGDTSGALFNWIKNENRLNIKGLNGNYYNATNLSYGNIKMSINDKPISTESSTSVTSLSSLSIDHNLVVAKLSGSQSFSLSSIPNAGREIHVLVNNNGTSDITITLPTASPYVPVNGDHTTVPVGGYAEINAISDGTKIYLRAL